MNAGRWNLLYDAIACGMRAYSDVSFRIVVVGGERLRVRPHQLLVSTHRSDTDVPLLCGRIYFHDRMYARHSRRLLFAARDDLFERGVVAGLLPAGAPLPLRRALYRVNPGSMIGRWVTPAPNAATVYGIQALRFAPSEALDSVLPAPLVARMRERAAALGISPLRTAADADRAELADLAWAKLTRAELPDAPELWRARSQAAAAHLRRLISLVRSGEPLLLFPEGRPSPDGSIGPCRRGVELLVRRGKPHAIVPLAPAYDPLTGGRPRVVLAVGEPFSPTAADIDDVLLDVLRRTTPLTCGQVVCEAILRAAEGDRPTVTVLELDRTLAAGVDEAAAEGRPVDPALGGVESRRRRLSEALAALVRGRLATAPDGRTITLARGRVRADALVRRLALEYTSARGRRVATSSQTSPPGEVSVEGTAAEVARA